MSSSIIAISIGAALGAVLRWGLALKFNTLLPSVPFGTLAANLIGGYLIGFGIAFLDAIPNIAPEWRLFLLTGFCGGRTTFSTFSAEVGDLIQQEKLGWAIGVIALHVVGSLLLTLAGLISGRWLQ